MSRWVHQNGIACLFQSRPYCSYQDLFCSLGDCDYDDDCEGVLVCFFRGYDEDVAGCLGGEADNDYCVDPLLLAVLAHGAKV